MNIKPCEICKGTRFQKLGTLCSNMKIMGPQFSEGSCDIVACSDCGFVFNQYENADQACFDMYYRSSSSKTMDYYDIYPKDVIDTYFEHLLHNLEGYISKDSRILDVAGGHGQLAQYLIEHGYTNITILEIKPECIESVKALGIDVIEASLFDLQIQTGEYDLVLCDHSLEHFVNLGDALWQMKSLIKPCGHIYIEVPDIAGYQKQNAAPYHFLTYEHVCHFSDYTINNLANCFGLQIVERNKCLKGNDYPTLCVMYKLSSTYKPAQKDPASASALLNYVKHCEKGIAIEVSRFEESQVPLILWGVGASTAQLLNGNFDRCNVIQLVDSNPARQGLSFHVGGRMLQIEDPSCVENCEAVIFILSTAYKTSIERSIRSYGYQNETVAL